LAEGLRVRAGRLVLVEGGLSSLEEEEEVDKEGDKEEDLLFKGPANATCDAK
jgi:hypothetical protein